MRISILSCVLLGSSLVAVAGLAAEPQTQEPAQRQAFAQMIKGLSATQKLDFTLGKALFKRPWVSAPSSTQAADGLGPLYNARSCLRCHPANGRGRVFTDKGTIDASLVLHLSREDRPEQPHENVMPDPVYGLQLQSFAVPGVAAEGQLAMDFIEFEVKLNGAESVTLRQPQFRIENPAYGSPSAKLKSSARLAPAMIGLGLLQAISNHDIEALADPDDRNQDGISGRINRIWNTHTQQWSIGRFGWKAAKTDLEQQVQDALWLDLGLANPLHQQPEGDCQPAQSDCLNAPNGNSAAFENLEAHSEMVRWLSHYSASIKVPERRQHQHSAAGQELFRAANCHSCHVENFTTAADAAAPFARREIAPYSDLLLHDMGPGLADQRREAQASGREWRTAPLWGIGLTAAVNGNNYYLHDGRARSLLEAILWHDGEARAARDRVLQMSRFERHQLIEFIESL